MPYIAFDLDALKSVPDAARAAKLSEAELGYGLVRLWSHCWNARTAVVSGLHLAGFFGSDIGSALAAFGFLELDPKGWRVRGAERYLRVREHQKRAGKARASGSRSADGRLVPRLAARLADAPAADQPDTIRQPALTPSTEHRAPNTESKAAAAAENRLPSLRVTKPPDDPLASGEAFFAFAQCERVAAGLPTEPVPRNLSAWWSETLMETNGEAKLVLEALKAFAVDPYWRKATPPLPFKAFMKQLPSYLPQRRAS